MTCTSHPEAPHGFDRNASLAEDRYVCDCESWAQPHQGDTALRQVIARILLDRNAGDDWMGDPVTWEAASEGLRDLFRAQADIVIGRVLSEAFDATLLDFGAWLAEELTGQPISPVDLQSCLEDWKG